MGRLGSMQVAGAIVLIALILTSTIYGSTSIPLADTVEAFMLGTGLAGGDLSALRRIVFDLRLPRALFAAVMGAGLGVVGVVSQTTTRNDVADPFCLACHRGRRPVRCL